MKSIMQEEKECWFCHTTRNLELHHCIHGTANRKLADKYGLTVYLCHGHHEMVHRIADADLILKTRAQIAFEAHHRGDFKAIFGRNYLWEGNDPPESAEGQETAKFQAREASQ